MIIIAAMTRDRGIGKGRGLPWKVPSEYQHFLDCIRGHTVIMGRRSYQIFGDSLTSEYNIVVSRTVQTYPGALVTPTVDEAIELASAFKAEVFIAGGRSVYEQTLPLAEAMYLSYIEGEYEADTYFPEFELAEDESRRDRDAVVWTVERREDHGVFEFVVYRRTRSG